MKETLETMHSREKMLIVEGKNSQKTMDNKIFPTVKKTTVVQNIEFKVFSDDLGYKFKLQLFFPDFIEGETEAQKNKTSALAHLLFQQEIQGSEFKRFQL